jgi:two-component system, OmpR family, response regulator
LKETVVRVTPPKHILVVDDEPAMREALRRGLEAEGYAVSEAESVRALTNRLKRDERIDLITLDLMLGSEDGLQLARKIRAERNVPIIMITARTSPIDRVAGLEHGADDYIVKPFHFRELHLRISTVLRRYEAEDQVSGALSSAHNERYSFEAGTLDVRRRELISLEGTPVALTDAEFDILIIFLRNAGRVLSRDELVRLLKGHRWSPTDRTIDGHIARLRKKIEPVLAAPRLIKTVWRVGYVFAGDTRKIT